MHDLLQFRIMRFHIGGTKRPLRGGSSGWRPENVRSVRNELCAPPWRGSAERSTTPLVCAFRRSSSHLHAVYFLASGFQCVTARLEKVNIDSVAREAPGKQKTCDSTSDNADYALKSDLIQYSV